MGHHYIPRAYLRHFASAADPERVWMYDKKTRKKRHSLIKEVAQKPRFYRSDVESSLNTNVELPGTLAMIQLLRGVFLSNGEREDLSRYIATMIKRVPYHRNYVNTTLYPELLARTTREYREKLRMLETQFAIPAGIVDLKLAETDTAEKKLLGNMPNDVRQIIEDPRPQTTAPDPVSAHFASFHWRVFKCSGPSFFLTTDNPVYRYAELIFPLSSTHCLHGDPQRPGESLAFSNVDEKKVRGINRKTVGHAERYVYYNEDVEWIQKLLKRRE